MHQFSNRAVYGIKSSYILKYTALLW